VAEGILNICYSPAFFLLAAMSYVLTGQNGVARGFDDSKYESSEGSVFVVAMSILHKKHEILSSYATQSHVE
jgi:hypothetical protein